MNEILLRFEHLLKKNPIKAVHLLKKQIAEQPYNYEYLTVLGSYLAKEEKDTEAVRYLERAKKIQQLESNHSFLLALSYMRLKDYTLAIKNFGDVAELYPEASYNTAICYLRKFETNKALAEARKLVKNEKMGKSASRLVIDILLYTELLTDSSSDINDYKDKYGEDDYYHYVVGLLAFSKKNYLESAYHLSRIDDSSIDRTIYLDKLANSYSNIKQYRKAVECYQELESKGYFPSTSILLYLEALYKLNEYEEVIKIADKYASKVVNKTAIKDFRAKAYYMLNLD